ncbi:EthD family reductase [Gordonia sp. ABSL49_1]|uniref:EthD family reductase n=1 Tax=Gordonia sp. ABSL49_1 TaxID=2920941 RepID=UPI001F0F0316|nr:EthD family reductase [Gordonia sp. ABSL49_1]MCH5643240.1 EthD family reductase [Gordonia sp. ABSL49_1]
MYDVIIIYSQPNDSAAFDDYYATKHVPLVDAITGVRAFTMNKCESLDENPPAAYALAQLRFDSKDDALRALGSPAGQAAAADVANFATGGATMLFSGDC